MKSKPFIHIYCLAAALLLSLSLSAEPMDHSTMHHEEHKAMLHDTSQHRSDDGKHYDHAGTMMHEESQHSMQSQHETTSHENMHHEAMQHTSGEHHAAASDMSMESADLAKLQTMPPSGKSREAGYDNRYIMESTSGDASIATKCAQASRGLVMVDNATWVKCGGKPEGWSKGIGDKTTTTSSMNHHEHMGH